MPLLPCTPTDLAVPESLPTSSASGRRPLKHRLIPVVLLVVFALQGAWFICTQSFSWDEPLHLEAGIEEWRHGSFRFVSDHPPLGHLLPAVFVAHDKSVQLQFVIEPRVLDLVAVSPDPEFVARRSRPVILMFGLMLGVLLWITARGLFSEGAANFALALFAFSPSLIAHFSMITTDGVTALTCFATAVQLMRWRKNPSARKLVLLGLLMGLLLLSKAHAPVLVLLTLAFVAMRRLQDLHNLRVWRWRPALAAIALAAVVVWGGYFFHVSHVTAPGGTLHMTFPPDPKPVPIFVVMPHKIDLWVPAGEYLCALLQTLKHNSDGQPKLMAGYSSSGFLPLMYPLEIVLKWPPILLLLCGGALFLFATGRLKLPPEWPVLVAFPVTILVMAMASRVASGERHLLPAYPFVLLLACATWDYARSKAPGKRALSTLLLVALAINAADVLRYAPDYLSYFNPLVSPRKSYRLLSFSDLDWGQGLLALKKYAAEHPQEKLYVATVGTATPAAYGIKAEQLKPNEFHSGTIVVSATNLAGFNSGGPSGYAWVQKYPLKTMLNHSLFVYQVP